MAKITKKEIGEAAARLKDYRSAKSSLDAEIRENEEWYRNRHKHMIRSETETVATKRGKVIEPASAWLLNSIKNRHADAMDNLPRCNVLPRAKDDEAEAYRLTKILPAVMARIDFERAYNNVQWVKPVQGWSGYCAVWDKDAEDGRGQIVCNAVNLLNLFWEQEVDNIQDSAHVYYVHLRDADSLAKESKEFREKHKKEKIGYSSGDTAYAKHDGNPQTSESTRVAVVDWYYKKRNKAGKTVVHLVQYVEDVVLYASENEPELAERGLYDHGKYPFIIDVLYPLTGQVAGFGEIAIGRNKQEYIDELYAAVTTNALWGARPRYFFKEQAGVSEEDFLNVNKAVVKYAGDPDAIFPLQVKDIHGNILNLMEMLIGEIKDTTGAQDVAMGGTTGGATAASAIAAQQEANGKLSRDSNRQSFRAFRELVLMIIELIRQFYTDERWFRILGESGEVEYIAYSNRNLATDHHPIFDLEITVEKESSYTRRAQNELVLQLYGVGFFTPGNAPAALAALTNMDFDGKDRFMQIIGENDRRQQAMETMAQTAVSLAGMLDKMSAATGAPTNYAAQVTTAVNQMMAGSMQGQTPISNAPISLDSGAGEPAATAKARETAQAAGSPV